MNGDKGYISGRGWPSSDLTSDGPTNARRGLGEERMKAALSFNCIKRSVVEWKKQQNNNDYSADLIDVSEKRVRK